MIKVMIEDSGVNFTKDVGIMTPKQIKDFIKLIKEDGVDHQYEHYNYMNSYYDIAYGAFLIVVNIDE